MPPKNHDHSDRDYPNHDYSHNGSWHWIKTKLWPWIKGVGLTTTLAIIVWFSNSIYNVSVQWREIKETEAQSKIWQQKHEAEQEKKIEGLNRTIERLKDENNRAHQDTLKVLIEKLRVMEANP